MAFLELRVSSIAVTFKETYTLHISLMSVRKQI